MKNTEVVKRIIVLLMAAALTMPSALPAYAYDAEEEPGSVEAAGDFECRIASREDVMEVLAVFKEAARLKLSVELW